MKIAQIRTKIMDVMIQAMKTFILVSMTCLAISSKDTQIEIIINATVPTKYTKPAIAYYQIQDLIAPLRARLSARY